MNNNPTEENKTTTAQIALTYGTLLGGASVIFAFMLYSLDMHYQGGVAVMLISVVLSLSAVVLGMLQFRKANGGFMSTGQAFKVGVGVCLIGGIIGIAFNQVMSNIIDPEMMNKAMEYQRNQLLQSTALTPAQIDTQMEMGKPFTTPGMQVLFGLIFSILSGFILSIVPALALKKQEVLD